MNKAYLYILLAFIFIIIAPLAGWNFYKRLKISEAKNLYKIYSRKQKIYCYELTTGKINYAMVAKDTSDAIKVSKYYRSLFDGNFFNGIEFPIKFVPYETEFHIINTNNTLGFSNAIAFDTVCWGYYRVYVSNLCVNKTLPSTAQIKAKEDFWINKENDRQYIITKANTSRNLESEYGCYCDL